MKKSCRKFAPKASPRPVLTNNLKQPLHAKNSFKNKILWEGIIKNLDKVNFSFSFQPSPF